MVRWRVCLFSLCLVATALLPAGARTVHWVSAGGNANSSWPDLLAGPSDMVFDSICGYMGHLSDIYQGGTGGTDWVGLPFGLLGARPNESSYWPAAATDPFGHPVVAFMSYASNLVEGDTNGCADIFVRYWDYDHSRWEIERVSVPDPQLPDAEANADCFYPAISPLGRYVTFCSRADNLALFPDGAEDKNGNFDVFCHDRETGRTYVCSPYDGGRWDVLPYRSSVSNSWVTPTDPRAAPQQDPPVVVFEWAYRNPVEFEGQAIYMWRLNAPQPVRLSTPFQRWCYHPDVCMTRKRNAANDAIQTRAIFECNGRLTMWDLEQRTYQELDWDPAYTYHNPHLSYRLFGEDPIARYIAYRRESVAAPGLPEVWVYDQLTDFRYCLSHDAYEQPVPLASLPALDYDGEWGVFYSTYDGMVPEDANGVGDVFLTLNELYPPHVESISPNGSPYVRPDASIVIRFNEPMDPASFLGEIIVANLGGVLAGSGSYDETTYTYTFTPAVPMTAGPYFVTVGGRDDDTVQPLAGVKDIYQVPMERSVGAMFYVTDSLVLLEMTPVERAIEVRKDIQVRARFSQPIDMSTVSDYSFHLDGDYYGRIPGGFSYEADSNTVVFTPSSPLLGDHYRVTVLGGASGGLVGTTTIPLDKDYTWDFWVVDREAPSLHLDPHDGSAVNGLVTIAATCTDACPLGTGRFYVDDRLVATFSGPPYAWVWNTYPFSVTDGPHTIRAEVADNMGNLAVATSHVTLCNTTFADVPRTAACWRYVEAVAREHITGGCSLTPRLYCPTGTMTRGQFAVFLCRAMGVSPYYPATPTFADVPASCGQYGYIEAMYNLGLAAGCATGPLRFCPNAPLSRGTMAVFLCRGAGIAPYNNPVPTFADVPASSAIYPYVEALFRQGISGGCGTAPMRFCPGAALTRAEMAIFLCRAFGIPLPTL